VAIVVVGGSTKDIGKTALVCGVIAALRDFAWTAVKITGHNYESEATSSRTASESTDSTVWEEVNAGRTTDTARYLAAGARRALLVTRHGPEVPLTEIRLAIEGDQNILFESNRIINVVKPDVCFALVGGWGTERKPSFVRLLSKADALVTLGTVELESAEVPAGIPRFELQSLNHLTPEMVNWLRSRLSPSSRPESKA